MASVEERVQRSIALLDEKGPPLWWERIDTRKLNLARSTSCVLGQVYEQKYGYGAYDAACAELGIDRHDTSYGFNQWLLGSYGGYYRVGTWQELEDAWQRALEIRVRVARKERQAVAA